MLLVDDHAVNRQLGVTVLNLLGCTVDIAENGADAVAAARKGGYDLYGAANAPVRMAAHAQHRRAPAELLEF